MLGERKGTLSPYFVGMTIEILFDMSMLQEFSAAISDKGGCRKLHGFEAEPVDDTDL